MSHASLPVVRVVQVTHVLSRGPFDHQPLRREGFRPRPGATTMAVLAELRAAPRRLRDRPGHHHVSRPQNRGRNSGPRMAACPAMMARKLSRPDQMEALESTCFSWEGELGQSAVSAVGEGKVTHHQDVVNSKDRGGDDTYPGAEEESEAQFAPGWHLQGPDDLGSWMSWAFVCHTRRGGAHGYRQHDDENIGQNVQDQNGDEIYGGLRVARCC